MRAATDNWCMHVNQVPSGDTLAAFHFNHGRSCQALGRLVQAAELFTATLAQCGGKHAGARSKQPSWRRLSKCPRSSIFASSDRRSPAAWMGPVHGLHTPLAAAHAHRHQRALEQRAECHVSLFDLETAVADWEALGRPASGADAAAKKAATRRIVRRHRQNT